MSHKVGQIDIVVFLQLTRLWGELSLKNGQIRTVRVLAAYVTLKKAAYIVLLVFLQVTWLQSLKYGQINIVRVVAAYQGTWRTVHSVTIDSLVNKEVTA